MKIDRLLYRYRNLEAHVGKDSVYRRVPPVSAKLLLTL